MAREYAAMAEQYDGGRQVITSQTGAHVQISIGPVTQGASEALALLTPDQAKILAADLRNLADEAGAYCG